ncbi:unnamed protein product [Closterium sp. NIES-54]
MIQFYPSAEEALDHGFSEFVSPQVLASLRALFQHNDASTRGVFFEQLSSTRTSINGWMRKVALTALGERGLAWHRELLIPFGSLIFSVSIKLALARRGVNSEKIKTRQLGWILYAWEYNRIQYEEMCTRVKREVEIAVIDHGVPYANNTNTFNFPNGVYIDASDMETLVSRVQRLVRRGVAVAVTTSSRSTGTCGAAVAATGQVRSSSGSMGTGAEQQGQQGDRCGAAVAASGQVRSSSGSIGTGAEQQWQHGDRCGAAVAAWGQVWSSRGSMGTGAEQQWQHGDRCGAAGKDVAVLLSSVEPTHHQ